MQLVDILGIVATCAGLAMAASPILQIRRMRRTRSSNDVSLQYFGLLTLGFVAWIAYGLSRGDPVVYGTNSASFVIMCITILIALYYRRGGAKKAAIAEAAMAEAADVAAAEKGASAGPASGPGAPGWPPGLR